MAILFKIEIGNTALTPDLEYDPIIYQFSLKDKSWTYFPDKKKIIVFLCR